MIADTETMAIQDAYGEEYQHCWGCGPKNTNGMHIRSYPNEDGDTCICHIMPSVQYTGGIPENLFGGIIAAIFDCHGTASAAWFAHRKKGFELAKGTVIERFITARLEIDYKKPTPINKELTVSSKLEEITEKKAIVSMEIESDGFLCAQCRIIAVKAKNNM